MNIIEKEIDIKNYQCKLIIYLFHYIDQETRDILDQLGIGYLIDRELEELEENGENQGVQNKTWLDSKLSPGERQKLCFAL